MLSDLSPPSADNKAGAVLHLNALASTESDGQRYQATSSLVAITS